jgi:thioredoxin 1
MSILHLTSDSFDGAVATGTVLVDFWADWCGPCKMLAPIIEELSDEYADTVTFAKLDVDAAGEIAARYGISSIPTVLLFRNGEAVRGIVGAHPKEDYVAALSEVGK